MTPLMEEARQRWQGGRVGRVIVQNPGDAHATIQLIRAESERLSYNQQSLTFDGATGALIHDSGDSGAAAGVRGVMYGLHIGRFAGPLLRGLFLLSGLAGTAMVATGCILWATKQRQQAARRGGAGFGTRLVEHLNIAAIAGLPLAMAAFFWANRVLPQGLAQRGAWEAHVFFIAWGSACCIRCCAAAAAPGWSNSPPARWASRCCRC
ncbi:PepSY domain-containing protein [Pseudoroseomonas wenyumeiae]